MMAKLSLRNTSYTVVPKIYAGILVKIAMGEYLENASEDEVSDGLKTAANETPRGGSGVKKGVPEGSPDLSQRKSPPQNEFRDHEPS